MCFFLEKKTLSIFLFNFFTVSPIFFLKIHVFVWKYRPILWEKPIIGIGRYYRPTIGRLIGKTINRSSTSFDNIVQSGILMCSVVWRWSRDWKLEALPKITIGFALVEYLNHECREFKFSGSKPLIYIIAWLEFKSITQFSPIIFYITCLFFQTKNH